MTLARAVLFTALFYLTTALFMIVCSPLLLAPRRWALAGLKAHAHTTLWLMRWIVGTRVELRGREHLPQGPALVASKHQSAWDTIGLITIFPDSALVMKAELLKIPLYGWYARKFGMIAIRREARAAAMRELLRACREKAAEGRQILIFPEGTRKAPGDVADYKAGVVLLYEGLGMPCVPVAVNTGLFWPRRQWIKYPGTIVVEILEAIPPGIARAAFRERLERSIETAASRLVAEGRAERSTRD